MLAVILSILKVIFITLLVLLGILFLCLLFVLFCPIFYRAEGHKNQQSMALHLKGSWFFGLLKVFFDYPESGHLIVKFLVFTIYDSSRPPKEKKKEKAVRKANRKSDKNQYHPAINTALLYSIEEEEAMKAAVSASESAQMNQSAATESTSSKAEEDSVQEAVNPIEKILCSFRKIYDKIKHIRSEIHFYKKLYETPEARELILRILDRLKRVIGAMIPKKLEADLLLGTGQPDSTGYATAVYGILSPYLGSKVNFTPDFENTIFEGNFKAKGSITVFTILKNVLYVLIDPNFRIVLRRIKKHRAKLNKTVSAG